MEKRRASQTWIKDQDREILKNAVNMIQWMRADKVELSDASMTCLQATGAFICEKVTPEVYHVRPVDLGLGMTGLAILQIIKGERETNESTEEELHWTESLANEFRIKLPEKFYGPFVSSGRSGTWYAGFGKDESSFQRIEDHRRSCLEKYLLSLSCDLGLDLVEQPTNIQILRTLLEYQLESLICTLGIRWMDADSKSLNALSEWCRWAISLDDKKGLNTPEVCLIMIATRYYADSLFQTIVELNQSNMQIPSDIALRPTVLLPEFTASPELEVELDDIKNKGLKKDYFESIPEPQIIQPGWYNVPAIKTRALVGCNSAGVTEVGWRCLGAVANTRFFHDYNIQYCRSNLSLTDENGKVLLGACDSVSTAMKSLGHFTKYAYLSDASGLFQLHKRTVEQCMTKFKKTGTVLRIKSSLEEMLIAQVVDSGAISLLAYSECDRDDIWALGFSRVVTDIPDYPIDILSGEVSQGWRAWAECTGLCMHASARNILKEWYRLVTAKPLEPSSVICSASMVWLLSNVRHRVLHLWCIARVAHGSSVSCPIVVPDFQGMSDNSDWSPASEILKEHWACDKLLQIIEATATVPVPFPSWLLEAPVSVVAHAVVCIALPMVVARQEARLGSVGQKTKFPELFVRIADRLCEDAGDGWLEFGLKNKWNDHFAKILADFGVRVCCGTDLLTSVGTYIRGDRDSPGALTFGRDRSCCNDVLCSCTLGPAVSQHLPFLLD